MLTIGNCITNTKDVKVIFGGVKPDYKEVVPAGTIWIVMKQKEENDFSHYIIAHMDGRKTYMSERFLFNNFTNYE
jgi:hypothetical protein